MHLGLQKNRVRCKTFFLGAKIVEETDLRLHITKGWLEIKSVLRFHTLLSFTWRRFVNEFWSWARSFCYELQAVTSSINAKWFKISNYIPPEWKSREARAPFHSFLILSEASSWTDCSQIKSNHQIKITCLLSKYALLSCLNIKCDIPNDIVSKTAITTYCRSDIMSML
jgi:hypothetical protein